MIKEQTRCIVAADEIEQQIQSNFPLVLDAVAKELDSIANDIEFCLKVSPACVSLAEIAHEAICAFHNEAKRCKSE